MNKLCTSRSVAIFGLTSKYLTVLKTCAKLSSNVSRPCESITNFDEVKKFLNLLSAEEKRQILEELQLENAQLKKKEAEAKLASWIWRSKFGRPASVPPSDVDPSGSYCEISEDWLKKKVEENNKPRPPTFAELRQAAVFNAFPFIGFGFLDNLIMIVAGDYIDTTIGVYLGISTMAAAALGNTVSDVAGIGSAFYVENVAAKVGVRPPNLSSEQLAMLSCRWSANIGRGIGVCIGCLLGMFPLLFLAQHTKDRTADEQSKG